MWFSAESMGTHDNGLEVGDCYGVNQGAWVHVGLTYSLIPREISMYQNGQLCKGSPLKWDTTFDHRSMQKGDSTTNNVPPSTLTPNAIYFGTSTSSPNKDVITNGYRGLISHWNVWSSSLNRKQINLLFTGYYLNHARIVASIGNGILSWVNSTRGDGVPSDPLVLTTSTTPTQPTPPSGIEATLITGGALHLQILQPIDDGGVDILGYNIYYTTKDGVILIKNKIKEILPFLVSPSYTIGGLTANTEYNFVANVYTGELNNAITIKELSVDGSLLLEWKQTAVFLDYSEIEDRSNIYPTIYSSRQKNCYNRTS